MSIRNANIVSDGVPSELGILSFDLGIILGFACDFELFSCELQQTSKHRRLWRLAVATQPTIAGYFYQSAPCIRNFVPPCPEGTRIHQKPTASSEGAQLWDKPISPSLGSAKRDRLSSSTSYGMRQSLFGELYMEGWGIISYPQQRCFAACSGFHDIGPAPRNLQLILNLLAFVGAWLRRDAIASYVCHNCIKEYSHNAHIADANQQVQTLCILP